MEDDLTKSDVWGDPTQPPKSIIDDLKDFVEEFEDMIKKDEEKKGVPPEKSSQNEFRSMVKEGEKEGEERKEKRGGVGLEEMEQVVAGGEEKKEDTREFPFV